MQILHDASLRQLNTLALEARCDGLVEVQGDDDLRAALDWARENEVAVTVLGEGSNVVLAGDVAGLVLLQSSRGIELIEETSDHVTLRVAAGENWHALVEYTLAKGYYGLENLALIPGTVGAAPIQNIGAYGVELKSFVQAVHALRIDNSEVIVLSAEECRFAYRDSIFKHELRDQLVITAVDFCLSKTENLQLGYPALSNALANDQTVTAKAVFEAVVAIRRSKLPDPVTVPNVGSFFKNPVLSQKQATQLQEGYDDIPAYLQEDGRTKFAAAWLIDYCGWKGVREQGVGVHPEHALVLVNYESNHGADVLALATKISDSVSATFGVALEIEPRVYGRV
ncbi:MAG: UDP-N-acetylmuramate dehydrogenase [Halioglobus sp.]